MPYRGSETAQAGAGVGPKMERNFLVFHTAMFRDEQPDDELDRWFLGEDLRSGGCSRSCSRSKG